MDDQAIVRRCLEGDLECFQQIVLSHKAPLMAAAMTVLGNRQDAEDICQETFIQAFRHLASFDSGRDLRAWLYTILYRRCLNAAKRKRRFAGLLARLKAEPGSWTVHHDPRPDDPAVLPSGLYEVLNPRERTVLSLWVNEGYTAAEIAAILGYPPGTARYDLFNVRKKIRVLTEKEHENVSSR
jgi:RNA polymerase sigma-70 factor (ECF subfamily)